MKNHVELSKRAEKDLRKIGPGPVRDQLVEAMGARGSRSGAVQAEGGGDS